MSSYASISSDKLSRLIGTANAPTLINVRTDEDFGADPRLIPGATHRFHRNVQDWSPAFPANPSFRWKRSNPLSIATTAVVGLIAYPILQPGWVMVH